jgi:hypothetical protein
MGSGSSHPTEYKAVARSLVPPHASSPPTLIPTRPSCRRARSPSRPSRFAVARSRGQPLTASARDGLQRPCGRGEGKPAARSNQRNGRQERVHIDKCEVAWSGLTKKVRLTGAHPLTSGVPIQGVPDCHRRCQQQCCGVRCNICPPTASTRSALQNYECGRLQISNLPTGHH